MIRQNAGFIWAISLVAGVLLQGCSGPMGPGREERAWFPPFYASASNEDGSSSGYSAFLNMVRYDRTPEKSYTHVFPFYFHESSDELGGFTLIPPLYFERKREFEEDLFFLLWGGQKRGSRHDVHLLWPFIHYSYYEDQEDRWSAGAFPLFHFYSDGPRNRLKLLDVGLLHLLDLEWGIPGRPEEDSRGSKLSFVNLLNMVRLASFGDPGGYASFHLLTLFSAEKLSLYQYHWNEGEPKDGRTVLFPIYWNWKSDKSEGLHLWPLYGWDLQADGTSNSHFLYPLIRYGTGPREGDWSVDPLYPLVSIERTGKREHDRFLPFYYRSVTEEDSLLGITPLFWRYRDADDYTYDLLFPFYSHEEDAGEEDWRFLLWFFGFERSGDRKTFTFFWFIPISWGEDEQDDTREG